MNYVWRRIINPVFIRRTTKLQNITNKSLHHLVNKNINITSNLLSDNLNYVNIVRYKSKKPNRHDSDDEDEDYDGDSSLKKDSKVMKFSTTSLRTDAILKTALGVARNKIEQIFYESKIRINGKKILKKSVSIKIGDEIDVIKMVSPNNPDHLYVARVEILNIVAKEDSIGITARRFKNLLIENYEEDPYKIGSTEIDS
ncbi:mitochondrial transcription rescue factor 1 [Galleria mellonella]|uniref:Mitochondrial transcription rescue factor 1 n=1 Tax=Galleria mellonella TaxID=7137 RepID=A0A6J1X2J4_GALME|nr:mitochondrial transcription rescue factor 1 [Galleria mellonella]